MECIASSVIVDNDMSMTIRPMVKVGLKKRENYTSFSLPPFPLSFLSSFPSLSLVFPPFSFPPPPFKSRQIFIPRTVVDWNHLPSEIRCKSSNLASRDIFSHHFSTLTTNCYWCPPWQLAVKGAMCPWPVTLKFWRPIWSGSRVVMRP